jgi:hypothetical protein
MNRPTVPNNDESTEVDLAERLVPVALSALLEGVGQAYNRQPTKAAALVIAGLGLSTASGLNTWLARRVFGVERVTIGTDRIRPGLLAAWAATYAFALWDAWACAAGATGEAPGAPRADAFPGAASSSHGDA